jgi:hypothetical protein
MSNLCNPIHTLSNIAEIAENESRGSLIPSRWSKSTSTFVLIPHSALVLKINSFKKYVKKFQLF